MTEPDVEVAATPREIAVPPGYARGAPLPWWGKLGVKLGLAALGVHGARARRLGLAEPSFGHDDPGRLLDPPRHWRGWAAEQLGRPARTLLEVGPGRMVVRAPVLAALGFTRSWFVDPADTAPASPAPYRAAAALSRAAGLAPPDLEGLPDRAAVLAACRATLLTGGPAALRAVPSGSVDIVVSEAVLEHVRRADLAPLLAELRRVTAPGGCGLHFIDLHDHLGGALQHLRFGPGFWEGKLAARAGIYVNRLGLSAHVTAFRAAGFGVTVREVLRWPARPAGPRRGHPANPRAPSDDRICAALIELRG